VLAFFKTKGEVCTCPSRALIQESIFETLHGSGDEEDQGDRED